MNIPLIYFLAAFLDYFLNNFATLLMSHRLLDDTFILQLDLKGLLKYLLRDLVVLGHSFELQIVVIGAFF